MGEMEAVMAKAAGRPARKGPLGNPEQELEYLVKGSESGSVTFSKKAAGEKPVVLLELEDAISFMLYAMNGNSEDMLGVSKEEALSMAQGYLSMAQESLEELKL